MITSHPKLKASYIVGIPDVAQKCICKIDKKIENDFPGMLRLNVKIANVSLKDIDDYLECSIVD